MATCERLTAEGGSCALIVQHSDRLARGGGVQARHLIEIVVWAIKQDVQLLSVQDPEMLAGGEMRLLMGVIGGMRNHQDRKRKSLSVKDGMRRRAERGLHNGRGSLGFTNAGGVLKQTSGEAALVERIVGEFLAGRSQRAIAKALNADGARTKLGGTWHQGTIAKVLRNPHIAGLNTAGDAPCPCGHAAIIDLDTWRNVAAVLDATARPSSGRHGGRPTRGSHSHIFRSGLLKCGLCGSSLVPRSGRRSESDAYYCLGNHTRLDGCEMPNLPRAMVDDSVRRYFEQVCLDINRTREQVEQTIARKLAEARSFREHAEHAVARTEAQIARAEADYLAQRLDAERWQRLDSRLAEELTAARAEVDRFAVREREATAMADMRDLEADTLRHLAHLREVIAGHVRDADTLDALRLALLRLFSGFTVRALGVEGVAPAPRYWQPELLVAGGHYIEPHVLAEAIESAAPAGFEGEVIFPVLRREPLPAPLSTTAYAGLTR